MGLAASQARLLTITARLADNELRSQTINNAKMRLATQSAQASDEYVSALNNAQLMFNNFDNDGLTRKQTLTFNALTAYSPYNTQYGITNSAGLLMVNERDAANFEAHKSDLNGFLEEYGLEWSTSFFDESSGKLSEKLASFYGTGNVDGDLAKGYNLGVFFEGMTNDNLKALYERAQTEEASIERLNYDKTAQAYYNEIKDLYGNCTPIIRNTMLGNSTNKTEIEIATEVAQYFSSNYTGGYGDDPLKKFILGQSPGLPDSNGFDDQGNKFTYDKIEQYLTKEGQDYLKSLINSITDRTDGGVDNAGFRDKNSWKPSGINGPSSISYITSDGSGGWTTKIDSTKGGYTITMGGVTIHIDAYVAVGTGTYADDGTEYQRLVGPKTYIEANTDLATNGGEGTFDQSTVSGINSWISGYRKSNFDNTGTLQNILTRLAKELKGTQSKSEPGGGTFNEKYMYRYIADTNEMVRIPLKYSREEAYQIFMEEYFHTILTVESYLNLDKIVDNFGASETLGGYSKALEDFQKYDSAAINGTTSGNGGLEELVKINPKYLQNFQLMMRYKGADLLSYGSDAFKSVLDTYMCDLMLDVLGEPKYAWIDKDDPNGTTNPDVKAQWYSNLFTRMQHGYKVLENGLANSKEWMEYAFESGLVTMEQVDKSYNWISLDYKSCSNIYEDSDTSDLVAKAEAKYNRAMNDIKQKDNMYDIQLKNIDTEHSALQVEYDSVKKVMEKNIDRTMKFDQSG